MNQLYTTPEAAKATGIPEGTIRSWMSRHAGVFQENIHYVIENSGRKLWTETGLDLLRCRASKNESESADPSTAQTDSMLDAVLLQDAKQYAYEYWRQLPVYILKEIVRMRTNPSEEEKGLINQSVQSAIGIGTFQLLPSYIKGVLGEAES